MHYRFRFMSVTVNSHLLLAFDLFPDDVRPSENTLTGGLVVPDGKSLWARPLPYVYMKVPFYVWETQTAFIFTVIIHLDKENCGHQ